MKYYFSILFFKHNATISCCILKIDGTLTHWLIKHSQAISRFCLRLIFCSWTCLIVELKFYHHPTPVYKSIFFMSLYTNMLLLCFYSWLYVLNVQIRLEMLIISVSQWTYSLIYSQKFALYLGKFSLCFEVYQGLFFAFLLQLKDALGFRLEMPQTT